MIQRDYLVRQAEQLGRVLGIILSRLLGLKNQQKESVEISAVNRYFEEELDFNVDTLLAISPGDIVFRLRHEKGFDNAGLETLADILFTVADEVDSGQEIQLYERSLAIYEDLRHSDKKTFSYGRELRIMDLKQRIALHSSESV
jgi:hypothetical protein